MIENEKSINNLLDNLNNNLSEDITEKMEKLIRDIKYYQEGENDE